MLTSLPPNTTVYYRIATINRDNIRSAYRMISTSTLADIPGLSLPSFVSVTSSITVQWAALPASPSSTTAEGYRIDASTSPNFYPIVSTQKTSNVSATSLGLEGLLFQTTYYLRVGSLNWNSVPNYLSLGSSVTVVAILSSQTYNGSNNLTLEIQPSVLELNRITVTIPPNTFPTGTNVTVNASVPFVFDPTDANQASLSPLGEGVAVDIEAQGQQPEELVTVLMEYDENFLPAGTNEDQLVIANFRDGVWTILPTLTDTSNNTLRAQTRHFSLFAPFFVTAGDVLSEVNIYPIPWMPGSGDSNFDAQRLAFTNFPPDGKVRLYTILGEFVWEGSANAAGMMFWDGKNRWGHNLGSGTYLAVLTGGGGRKVTRVVVIR
jgi:hypothetical protein